MSGPDSGRESITEKGLEELKARIEELEGPKRREMADRIKAARELGDLKENAEYHIAKEDQAHLETEIKRLRARLVNAEVVEVSGGGDVFAFGQTAEVTEVESGKTQTWTLVGSTEADIPGGKISAESPVGAALRDAAVGSTVEVQTPRGSKSYRIEKLV